jgi:alanyl-tRNA synthetase
LDRIDGALWMTERLYYNDSFLYEFDAQVADLREMTRQGTHSTWVVRLDRTAFYPTSGGQPFDVGTLTAFSKSGAELKVKVEDVFEDEAEEIWHRTDKVLELGAKVHGVIDRERRRDHMQQHSGQHVLSAAFIYLFNYPTVSFHLGEESCSIDLQCSDVAKEQLVQAERLANEIIAEDRPVTIRYAARQDAEQMGVRKLPPREGRIRLIDISDFDLNACGGTHVRSSGQIGCILVRKTEKVKQGVRVEFVCGLRAVSTARKDFTTLTESAGLYTTGLYELPAQIRKQMEELKAQQRVQSKVNEELAELLAAKLAEVPNVSRGKIIHQVFADRDASFIKLLAQKLSRNGKGIIALLATPNPTPTLVFARSQDQDVDVGALLKEIVTSAGGRGGGGKDLAQGGVPEKTNLEELLAKAASRIR